MTYQLEMTEDDRCNLLIALGSFAGACHGQVPEPWQVLVRKIAALSPVRSVAAVSAQPNPPDGKAVAAAILSPPAQSAAPLLADRWTKKRPETYETIEAPLVKIEEKRSANGKYLRVTWPNQGRGYCYGSVWDEALFPFVKARLQQKTTDCTMS